MNEMDREKFGKMKVKLGRYYKNACFFIANRYSNKKGFFNILMYNRNKN